MAGTGADPRDICEVQDLCFPVYPNLQQGVGSVPPQARCGIGEKRFESIIKGTVIRYINRQSKDLKPVIHLFK